MMGDYKILKNPLFTTQAGWRERGRQGCSFSSCVMGGVLVSLNNVRTIIILL